MMKNIFTGNKYRKNPKSTYIFIRNYFNGIHLLCCYVVILYNFVSNQIMDLILQVEINTYCYIIYYGLLI